MEQLYSLSINAKTISNYYYYYKYNSHYINTTNTTYCMEQNCHLGLEFMEGIEDLVGRIRETCNPDFRLYITTEPHPKFPIGLLQMATKVTNEPPQGLRAGMLRSYTVIVDQVSGWVLL